MTHDRDVSIVTMQDLPDELLTVIFQFLADKDLRNAAQICRLWHPNAMEVLTWQRHSGLSQALQRQALTTFVQQGQLPPEIPLPPQWIDRLTDIAQHPNSDAIVCMYALAAKVILLRRATASAEVYDDALAQLTITGQQYPVLLDILLEELTCYFGKNDSTVGVAIQRIQDDVVHNMDNENSNIRTDAYNDSAEVWPYLDATTQAKIVAHLQADLIQAPREIDLAAILKACGALWLSLDSTTKSIAKQAAEHFVEHDNLLTIAEAYPALWPHLDHDKCTLALANLMQQATVATDDLERLVVSDTCRLLWPYLDNTQQQALLAMTVLVPSEPLFLCIRMLNLLQADPTEKTNIITRCLWYICQARENPQEEDKALTLICTKAGPYLNSQQCQQVLPYLQYGREKYDSLLRLYHATARTSLSSSTQAELTVTQTTDHRKPVP